MTKVFFVKRSTSTPREIQEVENIQTKADLDAYVYRFLDRERVIATVMVKDVETGQVVNLHLDGKYGNTDIPFANRNISVTFSERKSEGNYYGTEYYEGGYHEDDEQEDDYYEDEDEETMSVFEIKCETILNEVNTIKSKLNNIEKLLGELEEDRADQEDLPDGFAGF